MRLAPHSAVVAMLCLLALPASGVAAPPPTRVEVVRDTLHGDVIEDPYRWLEDQDSPETQQWVRDQMAYTRAQLDRVPGRDLVRAGIARYARLDERDTPLVRAGRLFYAARHAGQQRKALLMRLDPMGDDVVLVDPNTFADTTASAELLDVSPDGRLLAWGLRQGGADELEVRLLDTDTRKDLPGGLPRARYLGVAIDAKKQGAWFGRWEPQGTRVWYQRFAAGDKPRLVFGDKLGPSEIPVPMLSPDGRWLAVLVYVGSAGDEVGLFLREAAREGKFASVTDTLRARVQPAFAGDQLVLLTNWGAPNGRLMVVDAKEPGLAHWRELVAERKEASLEGFVPVAGRVLLHYLRNAQSELAVVGMDGQPQPAPALPGIGTAKDLGGEWTGTEAWWRFSSIIRPPSITRYDFTDRLAREWWRSPAPFDASRLILRIVKTRSADGTLVPFFLAQPRDLELDGTHPTILTGYGGFNVSQSPEWSPEAAAWIDQGGLYAQAILRGGGEYGEAWHRGGMRANKQHTFDDFIACAQWLIGGGYCRPGRLAIAGGSNGGLLVGAALTQRPDLFGAVLCEFPLLDMLRYHRFMVARFWVPEYGSAEDPEQYRWLRAYSPYHHLQPGVKYPAVMFTSGDGDTRVAPLHARKMAARMQALGGERPVLLHYDVTSGHSEGRGVDRAIDDATDNVQFLRWQLGLVTPQ